MKIMILTAATGGGHISAADALEEYIRADTAHEVVTVDFLKAINWFLDRTVCDSYRFMAKRLPELFGQLYKQTNKPNHFSSLVPTLNSQFSYSLNRAIHAVEPDVILSTHPFATEMVSHLKKTGRVDARLISVITDYGLHRAWTASHVDGYAVACEDMLAPLTALGIPREKIHPFGIPVHKAFFSPPSRAETQAELGFSPDVPTVLLMAGSFGVSGIIKMYRSLAESGQALQLIIITGKNQALYDAFDEEIKTRPSPACRVHLLLFTKEVPKYMNVSDLIITKPGGLTVSEALACNLPLAVFDAIPGQEEDNALFLERHGMGVRIRKEDNLAQLLSNLLREPDKLAAMRENCRGFDKSDAAAEILALAEGLVTSPKTAAERKPHRQITLRVRQ